MASPKSEKTEESEFEAIPDLVWPDDRNNGLRIGQSRFNDYDQEQERDYIDFAKRLAKSKINFWEICPWPEVFHLTGINSTMFTKKRLRNQFVKVSSKVENEFMENIKECGVCFESMTEENHNMLPCQHTFCKNCIEKLYYSRFKPSDEINDDYEAFIVVEEGAFNGFDPGIDENEVEEEEVEDDYDISCPNCRAKHNFPQNGLGRIGFPKNAILSDILKIEQHKDLDIIIRREKGTLRTSNR